MISAIDLHMHSLYSDDGEFSPKELVDQCSRQKIAVMAIADHNCVRANREAGLRANGAGILYIPAVEIDCTFQGAGFHMLGYGIDSADPAYDRIEENISRQSAQASLTMLRATQALGFDIAERDLSALADTMYWKDRWTGEMFAEALLEKPEYRDHPLLAPYRPGGDRSDNPYVNFYWDFYAQGKPCYAEITYPSAEDAISMIHASGGKAVLAHPGINLKGREEWLKDLVDMGIDGVEAYSSYHSASQADFFREQANRYGVAITCGSDYHGKTKPSVMLGGHGGAISQQDIITFLSKG